jgi:hypothetical protein
MLRSFGLRKDTREKIRAWVCSQRCVFTVSLYSNDFAVGDLEGFSSMVNYEVWQPFLNRTFSPVNRGFVELLDLLFGAGVNIRERARSLNVPMKKLKILVRTKKSNFDAEVRQPETWQDQVPQTVEERTTPPTHVYLNRSKDELDSVAAAVDDSSVATTEFAATPQGDETARNSESASNMARPAPNSFSHRTQRSVALVQQQRQLLSLRPTANELLMLVPTVRNASTFASAIAAAVPQPIFGDATTTVVLPYGVAAAPFDDIRTTNSRQRRPPRNSNRIPGRPLQSTSIREASLLDSPGVAMVATSTDSSFPENSTKFLDMARSPSERFHTSRNVHLQAAAERCREYAKLRTPLRSRMTPMALPKYRPLFW